MALSLPHLLQDGLSTRQMVPLPTEMKWCSSMQPRSCGSMQRVVYRMVTIICYLYSFYTNMKLDPADETSAPEQEKE
jgi:hypothetical protein